ncbi:MAG: hypothetical protein M0Z76_02375 [Gammaproteobacteria bacterium]|nr:hypothetical protein [Gammaproteobacteria bacterium]
MHTPTNPDEFLDLLDQAIFETRDMLSAIETEGEEFDLGPYVGVFEALERILVGLFEEIQGGRHVFGEGSLGFTEIVERYRRQIPFADVLDMLNTVQRDGF